MSPPSCAKGRERTHVLLWDIDGTLLTTRRAGIRAWEYAVEDVLSGRRDLSTYPTAGLTDVEIAYSLTPQSPEQDWTARRLVEAYEGALPDALTGKPVTAFPEPLAFLNAAKGRSDIVSLLLTGNTRRGAATKLRAAGLDGLIELEGGFSHPLRTRAAVAGAAWEAARRRIGPTLSAEDCLVIGDTRHDIDCARAIGVRALCVATGGTMVEELTNAGAWRAHERLPPATEFLGKEAGPRA